VGENMSRFVICCAFLTFFNGYSLDGLTFSNAKSKQRVTRDAILTQEVFNDNYKQFRKVLDKRDEEDSLYPICEYLDKLPEDVYEEVRIATTGKWDNFDIGRKRKVENTQNFDRTLDQAYGRENWPMSDNQEEVRASVGELLYYMGYDVKESVE
jgi:hypothetical protein